MKIAYLIRGNKAKTEFSKCRLPDGIQRTVGTYNAEGGALYFVTFSIDGNTIGNARTLAGLRDSLPNGENIRVLSDEASAKFCELLYPHFCRFEKGLRTAITVATCAEQGNFDDKHVVELEEQLSLEALYAVLFVDGRYVKEIRALTKGNFTHEDLLAKIDSIEEHLLWDVLFNKDDMPTFRSRRMNVKARRNDVMHYHKMTEAAFDEARELMRAINSEIDAYLDRVRSDVAYPKVKAESARAAAQRINETYADMLESVSASLDTAGMFDFSDQFSGIARMVADSVDTSSFMSVARIAANMDGTMGLESVAQQALEQQAIGLDIASVAQKAFGQQTIGLTTSVSKAIESMQTSMPTVDISRIRAMQAASESMRAVQASIAATMTDSVKGITDYYQQIIPHETLDNLRLASYESMDFTAGLGMGSALSHALGSGRDSDSDGSEDFDDEHSKDYPLDCDDE